MWQPSRQGDLSADPLARSHAGEPPCATPRGAIPPSELPILREGSSTIIYGSRLTPDLLATTRMGAPRHAGPKIWRALGHSSAHGRTASQDLMNASEVTGSADVVDPGARSAPHPHRRRPARRGEYGRGQLCDERRSTPGRAGDRGPGPSSPRRPALPRERQCPRAAQGDHGDARPRAPRHQQPVLLPSTRWRSS